ncbi:sensor histidine kinase [Sporocytophaga myxococcoides]|uniref:sensor histidine kinase n=1 Tax=Sporocytophaga myxococcoides TaxID=153721 RepID=UPI0003FCCF72|nr:PAS domain-containing sensor histidine kinase [Sporocytophaga myxococcoides]
MDHKIYKRNKLPLKTNNFFDYILDNSQIAAIFILDKNGIILGISQGVLRSYGYFPDELIGKHFSVLFIEEDRLSKKPEIEIGMVMNQGFATDFNYIRHKDGTNVWTTGESVFVKDDDGEVYIIKNVQQLNQEKLLEDFLRASEKKQNLLSEIINSVEHGIILFKALRNENQEIFDFEYILLNTATEKLLGRKKEELIGKRWLNEYPNMKEIGNFELHVKTMTTGVTQTTEFKYVHQGFNNWFKNKFIRVGQDKLLVTFDDITQQKLINLTLEEKIKEKTEEYLKANQELLGINEYLDRYAYVISHDLKAPLATIEGLVPFIAEDFTNKPIDESGFEMLDMIKTKTQDMRKIIEEVLQSAKKEKRSKEVINLYHLVQEVLVTLNPPKHFHILVQHSLPIVSYNRTALMQILQNIIGNAIKYMDKQQPLIQITFEDLEDSFLICIKDNGPGIPPENLTKIFNPFETAHTNKGIESYGLGLSIVKQLVEENKGKIWAESIVGQECKFRFTILK